MTLWGHTINLICVFPRSHDGCAFELFSVIFLQFLYHFNSFYDPNVEPIGYPQIRIAAYDQQLQLHSIVIDADASPSGSIAWYNHYNETSRIRTIRPAARNEKFGVQRMEMLAIYFAIADNLASIVKMSGGRRKKRRVIIAVRSDSKSTVEQLRGLCEIRDSLMKRIRDGISKLLSRIKYTLVFDHLDRSRNIAGLLLEQKRRREREKMLAMFPERPAPSFGIPGRDLHLMTIMQ